MSVPTAMHWFQMLSVVLVEWMCAVWGFSIALCTWSISVHVTSTFYLKLETEKSPKGKLYIYFF